ncbi:MAG TPA: carboxypeptidase-like regulatory domain-containing protein, partial [Flavobacteriaceae bacterium]|nr:carboxypeptidase-like regulatory domain-containing protein [Flavobacteriaceae bacterium]
MRKFLLSVFGVLAFAFSINAQTLSTVKGTVNDGDTTNKITNVTVKIQGTDIAQLTNLDGEFVLTNVPTGNQVVSISADGYNTQNLPVNVKAGETTNLGVIFLFKSLQTNQDLSTITLSDDELLDDEDGGSDNVSGLLVSSKDAFLRAAAFNFGQAWFRVRGYDSENGTVMINGIPMNKLYGGRPQWSNWGGLNDATRNQVLTNGLSPSNHIFGGILGTTNISTAASEYRPGTRITASATNRNYTGRFMVTHASGMKNKFAYAFSASRRFASEGYHEGTFYDSNSFFGAIEYKPTNNHSFNLTAIYTPNRRGKSSPNTQEVFDLMGRKYNSYWGYQEGDRRNSRVKTVEEPIVMLNHIWDINEKTSLNTSVAYQFGKIGNSRLGYYNVPNPDPTYYRYLPSYFLRDYPLDPNQAILAAEKYKTDTDYSQINWEALYETNLNMGTSRYYLYEDRNDDEQFSLNTVLTRNISENITMNLGATYRDLTSENFAFMDDLLGGTSFNDVNQYNEGALSDVNSDPTVYEGDKFLYHYNLDAKVYDFFSQFQFSYNKVDFYVAGNVSKTTYQREGLFQNELYLNSSFGKGEELNFENGSVKAGLTYKITGRHLLDFNAGYISKAPTLRNVYPNARVNHDITLGVESEKIKTADASYIFRTPKLIGRLSGYYTTFDDAIDISRYFNQSLGDFIAEVTTGIKKKHFGGELGVEYQVTPTIKVIGAAALGQYTYDNNPDTYYTSDDLLLE